MVALHTLTGIPTSCPVGFMPPECQEKCSSGYFGLNCVSKCPATCLDRVCNPDNGACNKCQLGFTGSRCSIKCKTGYFGQNCGSICPLNCLNNVCDPFTGYCEKCMKGYTGVQCEKIFSLWNHSVQDRASGNGLEDGSRKQDGGGHVTIYIITVLISCLLPMCVIFMCIKFSSRKFQMSRLDSESQNLAEKPCTAPLNIRLLDRAYEKYQKMLKVNPESKERDNCSRAHYPDTFESRNSFTPGNTTSADIVAKACWLREFQSSSRDVEKAESGRKDERDCIYHDVINTSQPNGAGNQMQFVPPKNAAIVQPDKCCQMSNQVITSDSLKRQDINLDESILSFFCVTDQQLPPSETMNQSLHSACHLSNTKKTFRNEDDGGVRSTLNDRCHTPTQINVHQVASGAAPDPEQEYQIYHQVDTADNLYGVSSVRNTGSARRQGIIHEEQAAQKQSTQPIMKEKAQKKSTQPIMNEKAQKKSTQPITNEKAQKKSIQPITKEKAKVNDQERLPVSGTNNLMGGHISNGDCSIQVLNPERMTQLTIETLQPVKLDMGICGQADAGSKLSAVAAQLGCEIRGIVGARSSILGTYPVVEESDESEDRSFRREIADVSEGFPSTTNIDKHQKEYVHSYGTQLRPIQQFPKNLYPAFHIRGLSSPEADQHMFDGSTRCMTQGATLDYINLRSKAKDGSSKADLNLTRDAVFDNLYSQDIYGMEYFNGDKPSCSENEEVENAAYYSTDYTHNPMSRVNGTGNNKNFMQDRNCKDISSSASSSSSFIHNTPQVPLKQDRGHQILFLPVPIHQFKQRSSPLEHSSKRQESPFFFVSHSLFHGSSDSQNHLPLHSTDSMPISVAINCSLTEESFQKSEENFRPKSHHSLTSANVADANDMRPGGVSIALSSPPKLNASKNVSIESSTTSIIDKNIRRNRNIRLTHSGKDFTARKRKSHNSCRKTAAMKGGRYCGLPSCKGYISSTSTSTGTCTYSQEQKEHCQHEVDIKWHCPYCSETRCSCYFSDETQWTCPNTFETKGACPCTFETKGTCPSVFDTNGTFSETTNLKDKTSPVRSKNYRTIPQGRQKSQVYSSDRSWEKNFSALLSTALNANLPAEHALNANLPAEHALNANLPAEHALNANLPAEHALNANLPAEHASLETDNNISVFHRSAIKKWVRKFRQDFQSQNFHSQDFHNQDFRSQDFNNQDSLSQEFHNQDFRSQDFNLVCATNNKIQILPKFPMCNTGTCDIEVPQTLFLDSPSNDFFSKIQLCCIDRSSGLTNTAHLSDENLSLTDQLQENRNITHRSSPARKGPCNHLSLEPSNRVAQTPLLNIPLQIKRLLQHEPSPPAGNNSENTSCSAVNNNLDNTCICKNCHDNTLVSAMSNDRHSNLEVVAANKKKPTVFVPKEYNGFINENNLLNCRADNKFESRTSNEAESSLAHSLEVIEKIFPIEQKDENVSGKVLDQQIRGQSQNDVTEADTDSLHYGIRSTPRDSCLQVFVKLDSNLQGNTFTRSQDGVYNVGNSSRLGTYPLPSLLEDFALCELHSSVCTSSTESNCLHPDRHETMIQSSGPEKTSLERNEYEPINSEHFYHSLGTKESQIKKHIYHDHDKNYDRSHTKLPLDITITSNEHMFGQNPKHKSPKMHHSCSERQTQNKSSHLTRDIHNGKDTTRYFSDPEVNSEYFYDALDNLNSVSGLAKSPRHCRYKERSREILKDRNHGIKMANKCRKRESHRSTSKMKTETVSLKMNSGKEKEVHKLSSDPRSKKKGRHIAFRFASLNRMEAGSDSPESRVHKRSFQDSKTRASQRMGCSNEVSDVTRKPANHKQKQKASKTSSTSERTHLMQSGRKSDQLETTDPSSLIANIDVIDSTVYYSVLSENTIGDNHCSPADDFFSTRDE